MSNSNETKTPAASTAAKPTRKAIEPGQIIPNTKIQCSKDAEVGAVDHMQGRDTVKLRKDEKGVVHYIPLSWVARIDGTIHLDRPLDQVKREWSLDAPKP